MPAAVPTPPRNIIQFDTICFLSYICQTERRTITVRLFKSFKQRIQEPAPHSGAGSETVEKPCGFFRQKTYSLLRA